MARVFIGVGSNIDPQHNVLAALRLLKKGMRVTRVSTFYQTEPEGRPEQPPFYNGVLEVETEMPARELKGALRGIEAELGRERGEDKYAPRTIDLDILLCVVMIADQYQGVLVESPGIWERGYVVVPLSELLPDLWAREPRVRLRDLAKRLRGRKMKALKRYTKRLREESADGSGEG